MRATIRDVAKAAGVSPFTVSRALSTPELVNDETRERVRKVAARLGYALNRAARGLITGRTDNVGSIVPDLLNPFVPNRQARRLLVLAAAVQPEPVGLMARPTLKAVISQ